MNKIKVTILGSTGMLGSMVLDVLAQDKDLNVTVIDRDYINARKSGTQDIARALKGCKWVINCIGITKPHLRDDFIVEVENAILVNALFPQNLAYAADQTNTKIIQIATDCVYSGDKGSYVEDYKHDALDVYGKTKSLGEVHTEGFYNLRCSIIGPEHSNHLSLMDWFLGQSQNAKINGFTNHRWNGITTYHFAKICQAIIKNSADIPQFQHIIPADIVTKAELLKLLAKNFDREDIIINEVNAPVAVDRTLATNDKAMNKHIWQLAGYKQPPAIEQMIAELREYQE